MGIFDFLTELVKAKKDNKDSQVVVKNYIKSNNNNQNSNNSKNTNPPKNPPNSNYTNNNKSNSQYNPITLEKVRLYCTGAKGKVYTTTFRKSINHNFGIEAIIRNNTSNIQTVKLGHCIYDEKGTSTIFKGTFHPKIKPHSTLTENIFVDSKAFAKMKKGKYKSQFWINDKKVQKVFFTITEK